MYSCSISFRKLKNAVKISFPLFRGSWGLKKIEKKIWNGGLVGEKLEPCELYTVVPNTSKSSFKFCVRTIQFAGKMTLT